MPIAEWNRVLANAAFYALAMKTVDQLDCQSAIRIPRSAFPRRHHYMRDGTLDAFVERLKRVPGIVAIAYSEEKRLKPYAS
jgi:hypothetical protein